MLRRNSKGAFRFRTKSGTKCAPSAASEKRHIKLFGTSGGRAHRKHHKRLYRKRLASLVRARMAKGAKADFNRARRM